jgi:di/tricarboxylate transporter
MVLAIRRDGQRIAAPPPDTVVRDGDILMVEGKEDDLRELLRLRGLEIAEAGQSLRLGDSGGLFTGVVLRVGEGSALIGHTVQKLRFRERYGGLVVALWRDGERIYDRPGGLPLEEGDELFALGDRSEVEQMAAHPDFDLVEIGPPTMRRLQESVFQLRVTPGSALADLTVRECRVGELTGLTIVGRIPLGGRLEAVTPDDRFAEGDLLLVSGEPTRVANLLRFGDIEVDERFEAPEIESAAVKVVEAIVAPRSSIDGRTLRELDFRGRYGLQVLALMRGGDPIHEGLADLPLRVGDALLLQGPVARLSHLGTSPDFLVLTPGYQEVFKTQRAPVTLAALVVMIGVVATGIYPIQIAAFMAAIIVVALGALTMEQAYRTIDWRTVFLVASVLPLGTAIDRSGTALWLAAGVAGLAPELGPYALLIVLMLLSSLLSQVLTGAPTVAILAPVAFVVAQRTGVSVRPLMMGIALAASITFMAPISHKANLLVMSAGGYKLADYLRIGTVLTLATLAIIALMVPLLLPF